MVILRLTQVLAPYLYPMSKVIYQYFLKELPEAKILVRINPKTLEGLELIVLADNNVKSTAREFDETIYDDLKFDSFIEDSALEFNLRLNHNYPKV